MLYAEAERISTVDVAGERASKKKKVNEIAARIAYIT